MFLSVFFIQDYLKRPHVYRKILSEFTAPAYKISGLNDVRNDPPVFNNELEVYVYFFYIFIQDYLKRH